MNNQPSCEPGGVSAEIVSGNQFIRVVHLHKKGDFVQGHTHNFDHNTVVFKGSINIKQNGEKIGQDFYAPGHPNIGKHSSHAFIDKNIEHGFTALEDDVIVWCMYSHRDAQGEVVQEFTGWKDVVEYKKIDPYR